MPATVSDGMFCVCLLPENINSLCVLCIGRLVSRTKGRTSAEGVYEQGDEEGIWG
jgi:hypothetical protein